MIQSILCHAEENACLRIKATDTPRSKEKETQPNGDAPGETMIVMGVEHMRAHIIKMGNQWHHSKENIAISQRFQKRSFKEATLHTKARNSVFHGHRYTDD